MASNPTSISEAEKAAQQNAENENEETFESRVKGDKEVYDKLMKKAQAAIEATDERNAVDPSQNEYTDTKNGEMINDTAYSVTSEDAVTIKADGKHAVYELVPASRLEKKAIIDGDKVNSYDSPIYVPNTTGTNEFKEVDAPDNEYVQEKDTLEYDFGIDSIEVAEKSFYKTSGFISPEITLNDSCYHIELDGPVYSSLEYYIIDGDDTTAILPQKQMKIEDEKLFYQMPTRFTVEDPDSVVIRMNGQMTNYGYMDLMDLPRSTDKVYTISYTPSETGRTYIPKHKKIRVKVIQRIMETNAQPKPIDQIVIKSYGGVKNYGL